jgi:exonuclease V
VVQGCWVVGIIDELQLCGRDGVEQPLLIDTKTRNRPTPPSEPQKRNGRYKCGNI